MRYAFTIVLSINLWMILLIGKVNNIEILTPNIPAHRP